MRIILFLISFLIFAACSSKPKPVEPPLEVAVLESKFTELLKKFKPISKEIFKVYSYEDFKDFKGKELDSLDALLFPTEISERYFQDSEGIFACYQFAIDSNRIGLIARTPGEYVPSSIKLFIYDKQRDKLTSYLELAESIGDAGYMMSKTSWIIQDKKDIQVLTWVHEKQYNEVMDYTDTTVSIWDYHYLINISKNKFDTLSKNSGYLTKKYASLLQK